MNPQKLRAILFAKRLPTSTEQALQDALERRLQEACITYEREHAMPAAGRIDFRVAIDGQRIGIECKIRSGGGDTVRQVIRYAQSGEVDQVVLIGPWQPKPWPESVQCNGRAIPTHFWKIPTL